MDARGVIAAAYMVATFFTLQFTGSDCQCFRSLHCVGNITMPDQIALRECCVNTNDGLSWMSGDGSCTDCIVHGFSSLEYRVNEGIQAVSDEFKLFVKGGSLGVAPTLSGLPGSLRSVSVTAIEGADYRFLNISTDDLPAQWRLDIEDDDIALEYDDQLNLVYFPWPPNIITSFEAENQFVRNSVPVHIEDNDRLEINFDEDVYSTDEGDAMGLRGISLSLRRTQAPFSMELIPVTIDVAKSQYNLTAFLSLEEISDDKQAQSGVDFNNASFTTEVPAGTTTIRITNVTVVDDDINEREEVFVLVAKILDQAENEACFQLDENSPCRSEGHVGGTLLRIRDDDVMFIGFSERFSFVRENWFPNSSMFNISPMLHSLRESEIEYHIIISVIDGTATVTDVLNPPDPWDVLFGVRDDSSDVLMSSYVLNAGEAAINVVLTIHDDVISENNETLTLRVSPADTIDRAYFECYNEGEIPEEGNYFCFHTITIVDDDEPFEVSFEHTLYEVDETSEQVEVCVLLTSPETDIFDNVVGVEVFEDFFITTNELFPSGAAIADGNPPDPDYEKQEFGFNLIRNERITEEHRRVCYNQTVYDDIRLEATEYFGLTLEVQDLESLGGPTTIHTVVGTEHAAIRIMDNDGARVGLEETFYQVDEADGTVEICAVVYEPDIICPIDTNFAVTFETRNETAVPPLDYGELILLFMFSSCDTRKCISVQIEDDNVTEETEFFSVSLKRTTNLDPRIILDPKDATVNITDNDGNQCFQSVNCRGLVAVALQSSLRDCCVNTDDGLSWRSGDGSCTNCIVHGFNSVEYRVNEGVPAVVQEFGLFVKGGSLDVAPTLPGLPGSISSVADTAKEGPDYRFSTVFTNYLPAQWRLDIEDDDIALEYDDQLNLVYYPRPSNVIIRFEAEDQFIRCNTSVRIEDNDKLKIRFDEDVYSTDESNTMGLNDISLSFSQTEAPFSMKLIPVTIDVANTQYNLTDFLSLDNIAGDQEAQSGADFSDVSFEVEVQAGATSVSITNITVVDDNKNEKVEFFVLIAKIIGEAASAACFQLDENSPCKTEGHIGGTRLRIRDDDDMIVGFPERFSTVRENMFSNVSVFNISRVLHSYRESEIEYPITIGVIGGTAIVTEAPLNHNGTWDVSFGVREESSDSLMSVLNLRPGETETTAIQILINNDMKSEENETFTLQISVVDDDIGRKVKCYRDGETPVEGRYFCSHTITIVDDEEPLVVSFEHTLYDVAETAGQVEVCVILTSPDSGILEVIGAEVFEDEVMETNEHFPSGAAIASGDLFNPDYEKQEFGFSAIRNERITEEHHRVCYNQTVYDDIRLEATEYFGLTLEVQDLVAQGGPTTANTQVDIEHTAIRIIDNDMARVGFEKTLYQVNEANGRVEICAVVFEPNILCPIQIDFNVTFETRNETAGTKGVSVPSYTVYRPSVPIVTVAPDSHVLFAVPSSDYGELTLLFMFRSCDTRKCISVHIENDDITEETEFFSVSLRKTKNFDSRIILDPKDATVNITDNDGQCFQTVDCSGARVPDQNSLRECCVDTDSGLSWRVGDGNCTSCIVHGFSSVGYHANESVLALVDEFKLFVKGGSLGVDPTLPALPGSISSFGFTAKEGPDYRFSTVSTNNLPAQWRLDIEDDDIALEYDDQLYLMYYSRPSNVITRFEAENQFIRYTVGVHIEDNDRLEINFDENDYSIDESDTAGFDVISVSLIRTQEPFRMELIPVTIEEAKTAYILTDLLDLHDFPEAKSGFDFYSASFTIDVPAETTIVWIPNVAIVDDKIIEGEEEFVLVAKILGQAANEACFQLDENGPCRSEGHIGGTLLRIRDDDDLIVGFPERFSTVRENMFSNVSVFNISRVLHSYRESGTEYPIIISVIGGTATVTEAPLNHNGTWDVSFGVREESSDVLVSSYTLSAGEATINVVLTIHNDVVSENNETLTLIVSSANIAERRSFECYDDGQIPEKGNYFCSHTITIVDDDEPFEVSFEHTLYEVDETSGQVEVCVLLTSPETDILHNVVGVEVFEGFGMTTNEHFPSGAAIADGNPSDPDYEKQEFGFNAIRNERITEEHRRVCYNQTVYDDTRLEAAEYFGLTLKVQNLVTQGGPTTGYTVVGTEHVTIKIMDNNVATIGFVETLYRVDEADGTVEVCADVYEPNITCPIEFDFNVTFETRDETAVTQEDYEGLTTLLIFKSCETRKCVNVTIVNNDIVEDTESFSLRLMRTSNLDSRISLNPDNATVEVTDNDGTVPSASSITTGVIVAATVAPVTLVTLTALLIVLMLVVYLTKMKRQKASEAPTWGTESITLDAPQQSLIQQLLQQFPKGMVFSKDQIHLSSTIGQGEFGLVYKAYLQTSVGSQLVAVKTVKALFSTSDVEKLTNEIDTMLSFDHPNVMSVIGVSVDRDVPFLIMPFMANGSVLEYVKHHKEELLLTDEASEAQVTSSRKLLLGMCHQIAKGMKYLAEHKFVHRDLAARNCMIDMEGVIKVADFGLTEDIYTTRYYRQEKSKEGSEEKVPIRWMAPESIENNIYNENTDVWAFGVTCWEIFTCGRVPYHGISPMGLLTALKNGERLEKPKNAACSDEIYVIMTVCWMSDPQERAKFASLAQQLSNLLEQEAGYLDLRRSLSWRTHGKPQTKAFRAKAPVLPSIGEKVTEKEEESIEMEEANIKGAKEMGDEQDSAV